MSHWSDTLLLVQSRGNSPQSTEIILMKVPCLTSRPLSFVSMAKGILLSPLRSSS